MLLMELAFLLRNVGSHVVWITYPKSEEKNEVTYSLEHKMLTQGVQVLQHQPTYLIRICSSSVRPIHVVLLSRFIFLNTTWLVSTIFVTLLGNLISWLVTHLQLHSI